MAACWASSKARAWSGASSTETALRNSRPAMLQNEEEGQEEAPQPIASAFAWSHMQAREGWLKMQGRKGRLQMPFQG